jgi:hypothetical protein
MRGAGAFLAGAIVGIAIVIVAAFMVAAANPQLITEVIKQFMPATPDLESVCGVGMDAVKTQSELLEGCTGYLKECQSQLELIKSQVSK